MSYRPQYKNAVGTVIDLPLDAETVQGVDVVAMLAGASGAQFAAGSSVGTGTYGTGSRTSLTFDFVPKLLIVQRTSIGSAATASFSNDTLIWSGGGNYGRRGSGSMAYADMGYVTVSGKTVSWYNTSGAERQMNTSNATYYYIALG